jgi:hypothetical protein
MNSAKRFVVGSYLRCPDCGSRFDDSLTPIGPNRKEMHCVEHQHSFIMTNSVPDLLPRRYLNLLDSVKHGRAALATREQVEVATDWLSRELGLPLDSSNVRPRDEAPRRLLRRVAMLVRMKERLECSDADIRVVYSILAAEAMSSGYRRNIADPASASPEAVNYEQYEDILLRKAMESCLATGDGVALIELGSGPGRVLQQYGSVLSPRGGVSTVYRRMGQQLYEPEYLMHRDRLQLVLGIDFVHDMLQSAARWFRENRLQDLVLNGTISQVRAAATSGLPIRFDSPEWRDTTRIACILYQTLGQQVGRDAQLDMLRAARELVGERGIVFVSAFNAQAFGREGASYYDSVREAVGASWYCGDRSFLSKRGVYSKWFRPNELRSLFDDAQMRQAVVLDGDALPTFPKYREYIKSKIQKQYKGRVLLGVYARGVDFQL